jgi:hypothetical protein
MPLHPNVRRCTHIQITGHRCGSPALKQEYFCYFHTRMIKGVQTRVDSQIHPIALIENAEAIQSAIMHMIDGVLKGTIDNQRAALVLKALYIAVRNSRHVYFRLRPDDMVREVPNYAQQYLTEHPELNPDEPKAPEPPVPETKKTATHPNRCAESVAPTVHTAAERRQNAAHGASRGNKAENHQAPEERKRTSDPSPHAQPVSLLSHAASPAGKDPDTFARGENIPPLTNRQSDRWNEIKKLEASIEGAMHGDWRDLRTVFNAVGLTPGKPPNSQKAHIVKRRCATKPTARRSTEIRPEP